jgi:DNA repair protein RecO (recombination protein O)
MLHETKGIVLRTVKYGETSVIVLIFTEKFGIQSYLINGVRISSKKSSGKAAFFQPAAILELVVYHNELKNIQRVREFRWSCLYRTLFSDITKNAVALFMVELITRCLKQPENHPELFHFAEDAFLHLDQAGATVTANYPLFFSLHLAVLLGFRIHDNYSAVNPYFDLQEGKFVGDRPRHLHFLEGKLADVTSQLLKVMHPGELEDISLHHEFRRRLLQAYETYYALHIQEFGKLRTVPVLREILN